MSTSDYSFQSVKKKNKVVFSTNLSFGMMMLRENCPHSCMSAQWIPKAENESLLCMLDAILTKVRWLRKPGDRKPLEDLWE